MLDVMSISRQLSYSVEKKMRELEAGENADN